jgi:hypothetical protein
MISATSGNAPTWQDHCLKKWNLGPLRVPQVERLFKWPFSGKSGMRGVANDNKTRNIKNIQSIHCIKLEYKMAVGMERV